MNSKPKFKVKSRKLFVICGGAGLKHKNKAHPPKKPFIIKNYHPYKSIKKPNFPIFKNTIINSPYDRKLQDSTNSLSWSTTTSFTSLHKQPKFIKRIKFSIIRNIPSLQKEKEKKIKKISSQKIRTYTRTYMPWASKSIEKEYSTGRWKWDEHQRFLEAIFKYGNDWKQVQKHVKTRSSTQARSHAQKFFIKIKKAKLLNFKLDLSTSSIKKLHDMISHIPKDKYDKLLKEMNDIAFDKYIIDDKGTMTTRSTRGRRSQNNKSNINSDYSTNWNNETSNCNTEYNMSDNYGDYEFTTTNMEGDSDSDDLGWRCRSRKCSIELEASAMRKNSMDALLNYKNAFDIEGDNEDYTCSNGEALSDKEYVINFNKAFRKNSMNSVDIRPKCGSRKISIEEDFMFNYVMK